MDKHGDKKDPTGITFYSNDELINELKGRFDALAIGAVRFSAQNETFVLKKRLGHAYICLGILESLRHDIVKTDQFPNIDEVKDR